MCLDPNFDLYRILHVWQEFVDGCYNSLHVFEEEGERSEMFWERTEFCSSVSLPPNAKKPDIDCLAFL
ncbi:hypothetical protein EFP84_14630 [Leptospira kmetyi]|uniref:Uncharacterized protein n=1 Tax=Leptospira kmetyi TaxID=408139 RepID=A0AAD0XRA1_9LEPT|nr:hypothetical protein EFP84_14630 [Leptospira kmetyi]